MPVVAPLLHMEFVLRVVDVIDNVRAFEKVDDALEDRLKRESTQIGFIFGLDGNGNAHTVHIELALEKYAFQRALPDFVTIDQDLQAGERHPGTVHRHA